MDWPFIYPRHFSFPLNSSHQLRPHCVPVSSLDWFSAHAVTDVGCCLALDLACFWQLIKPKPTLAMRLSSQFVLSLIKQMGMREERKKSEQICEKNHTTTVRTNASASGSNLLKTNLVLYSMVSCSGIASSSFASSATLQPSLSLRASRFMGSMRRMQHVRASPSSRMLHGQFLLVK